MRIVQVNTFYLNFLGILVMEGFGHSGRVERTPDFGFESPVLPLPSCVTLRKSPDLHFLTTDWGTKNSVYHIWGYHGKEAHVQCQSNWLFMKHYSSCYSCHQEDLKPVGFKNFFPLLFQMHQ